MLLDDAAKGVVVETEQVTIENETQSPMDDSSTSTSTNTNEGQLRPHQVSWAVDDIIEPGNAKEVTNIGGV